MKKSPWQLSWDEWLTYLVGMWMLIGFCLAKSRAVQNVYATVGLLGFLAFCALCYKETR